MEKAMHPVVGMETKRKAVAEAMEGVEAMEGMVGIEAMVGGRTLKY